MNVGCLIFATNFIVTAIGTAPLDESVSYCEFLGECETVSRLQEKLCLGNSIITPYWLPARDTTSQRCYRILRSRYEKLEKFEHESDSLLLYCMIERSLPLNAYQKQYCDSSLFEMVDKLRGPNGNPTLDQCFQGTKRFKRQCGPLLQCCNAYHQCKDLVKQSFITKQKELLLDDIHETAKKCKEGMLHAGNETLGKTNGTASLDDFPFLSTLTNWNDKNNIKENVLFNSTGKWYFALKAKLDRETKNTMFRERIISQKNLIFDKNSDQNQTRKRNEDNKVDLLPEVIEKWDNEEYRKSIEEYQTWKAQQHSVHSTEEKQNESFCDSHIRCRRLVEKSMDRCQIQWYGTDQIPLLSTNTLLQIGDRCIGQGDDSFVALYELVIMQNSQLQKCMNSHKNEVLANCSVIPANRTQLSWKFGNIGKLQNNANSATDCFAQVNAAQYACAQLSKCCPQFYRCREETFEAKVELQIASLTVQLISKHFDCLMRELMISNK